MAWYDTGTVAVTNGSTTVTGSGTNFLTGAQIGEAFLAPDDKLYEIASISSSTVLVLADGYLGSTQSGQAYKIVPTQSLVADLASDVTDLISDYATVKDTTGAGKFLDGAVATPSITFDQDQDTGFYRVGANELGVAVGGALKGGFDSDGLTLGDNVKAKFGSSDDLQIYHSGTESIIAENGTGDLKISGNNLWLQTVSGETYFRAVNNSYAKLYYDNAEKLATTSSGVDISGTVTMDALTVENSTAPTLDNSTHAGETAFFRSGGVAGSGNVQAVVALGKADGGSARSGSAIASVQTDADTDKVGLGFYTSQSSSSSQTMAQKMLIDHTGNVGIGTDSPSYNVDLLASNAVSMIRTDDTTSPTLGLFVNSGSSGVGTISVDNGGHMTFDTGSNGAGQAERMRITNAGELLVGKTTQGLTNAGFEVAPSGQTSITQSGASALRLNRLSSDGELLQLRASGSTIGSIGTTGGGMYIGSGDCALRFHDGGDQIRVSTSAGSNRDGAIDLGFTDSRFKDGHFSGTVNAGGLTVDGEVVLSDSGTPKFALGNSTNDFYIYSNAAGSERLRIDSSGNVGIGTSSPSSKLHLYEETSNTTTASNVMRIESRSSGTTGVGFGGAIYFLGERADGGLQGMAKVSAVADINTTYDLSSALTFQTASGGVNSERMRIDSSGNVGIGTSAPTKSLTVGSNDAAAWITSGGANTHLTISANGGSGAVILRTGGTNGDPSTTTERMRIADNGNVLVGTSSWVNSNSAMAVHTAGGGISLETKPTSDGYYPAIFYNASSSAVGYIWTDVNSTSYSTSSDYRLKEDFQPITGATDSIKALNPINFAWKADGSRVNGFLAHELQEVIPEAATGTKDAMRDEDYEVSPALGEVFTVGSEAGFTEVSAAIVASPAYYDVDGVQIKAEVLAQAAVHEATEAIAEVIHSSDVEKPETLEEGQQWRETTAQVMGTRSVPDMQGIDQSKLVPLLTAALQEALARIEALENK